MLKKIALQQHNEKNKTVKKKELLVSLQHSGFKYEPWSPVTLVQTPMPLLTRTESLGKPYFTSLQNATQTSINLMELY